MILVGPSPELLRESAAKLLQIASNLELDEIPHVPGSPAQIEGYSSSLAAQMALEMIDECKQRREIAGLGTFSDTAIVIVLLVIASKEDKLVITVRELEGITGLPVSSNIRLIAEISNRNLIRCEQDPNDETLMRLSISESMENQMASLMANRFRFGFSRMSHSGVK